MLNILLGSRGSKKVGVPGRKEKGKSHVIIISKIEEKNDIGARAKKDSWRWPLAPHTRVPQSIATPTWAHSSNAGICLPTFKSWFSMYQVEILRVI